MNRATSPEADPGQWSGRATNHLMATTGTVFALGAVLAALTALLAGTAWLVIPAVSLLASAIGLIELSCVTVIASARGLELRFGPRSWPVQRIGIRDIVSVEATEIDPLRWGGWGYRWVPWRRGWAVVVRRGSGLLITRPGGQRLAITCDDPAGAVAALQPHLAR